MSTESDSAKAVSAALMVSMEIEQEMKQIIVHRDELLEILRDILLACEETESDMDDGGQLYGTSNVISKVQQLALEGLLSASK